MSKLAKWNDAYNGADFSSAAPAKVLSENHHLLPNKGNVLDLACGRAGNALYLAQVKNKKFEIDAIDFSPVIINSLKEYVDVNKLSIYPILRDVERKGISDNNKNKYDVIVVSYFLDRATFPKIIDALNPDGLLFYQTWSQEKIDESGPNNPSFRLEAGELLEWCASLRILLYKEEGSCGDVHQGSRNEAMIIAKKLG